jgi:hypothetical protein
MDADIIEPEPRLLLLVTRAPNDPPLFSEEYQKTLHDLFASLKTQGLEVSSTFATRDAVGAAGGFSGEFVVAVTAFGIAVNQVRKLIETFLEGRDGRKLKVQIGSFRLEGSARDVEKMFGLLLSSEQFQKLLISETAKKKARRSA